MISAIIKVEVRLSAETKVEAGNNYRNLDYLGYHKNLIIIQFLIHRFEENNDKYFIARNLHFIIELILLLEIMHCAHNLQIN